MHELPLDEGLLREVDGPPLATRAGWWWRREPIRSIQSKVGSAFSIASPSSSRPMNPLPPPNINGVAIESISTTPNVEVEVRLERTMSTVMYELMTNSVFEHVDRRVVEEEGCSWWTGLPMNKNAKVRTRSTGEKVVKVPMTVQTIAPGIKLAVSHEYMFTGRITRPEYSSTMDELVCETVLENIGVRLISRVYTGSGELSYASEIEILDPISHASLRRLMNTLVSVIGSVTSTKSEIDAETMIAVRRAEHAVVDVNDISMYKGTKMSKTNGVKVYISLIRPPIPRVRFFVLVNLLVVTLVTTPGTAGTHQCCFSSLVPGLIKPQFFGSWYEMYLPLECSRLRPLLQNRDRVLSVAPVVDECRDDVLARDAEPALVGAVPRERIHVRGHRQGLAHAQRRDRGVPLDRARVQGLEPHLYREVLSGLSRVLVEQLGQEQEARVLLRLVLLRGECLADEPERVGVVDRHAVDIRTLELKYLPRRGDPDGPDQDSGCCRYRHHLREPWQQTICLAVLIYGQRSHSLM
ncbi:hypothetical protein B0T17DRAFT_626390 [Bombardia bombarda]|uniref:Uncharacterized protein n=1 Tax=Bombardia bombarda TaxID=252184 RepID=A0AA39XMY2_9PEZI|nr:hypothetical protein B0T17DRAFT_626390 [Bombardia bombarda]